MHAPLVHRRSPLPRRVWSDVDGRLLNPAHGQQAFQFQVERTMRLFYRLRYTHHRYMATADPTVGTLNSALLRSMSLPRCDSSGGEPAVDGGVAQDTVFASAPDERAAQYTELEELRNAHTVCDDRVQEELDQLADTLILNGESPTGLYLDLRCAPTTPLCWARPRAPVRTIPYRERMMAPEVRPRLDDVQQFHALAPCMMR